MEAVSFFAFKIALSSCTQLIPDFNLLRFRNTFTLIQLQLYNFQSSFFIKVKNKSQIHRFAL